MKVWNAAEQRWDSASTPDTEYLRAQALERRLRTLALVLAVVVLGTVATGAVLLLW